MFNILASCIITVKFLKMRLIVLLLANNYQNTPEVFLNTAIIENGVQKQDETKKITSVKFLMKYWGDFLKKTFHNFFFFLYERER